jgi:hypothetical protein
LLRSGLCRIPCQYLAFPNTSIPAATVAFPLKPLSESRRPCLFGRLISIPRSLRRSRPPPRRHAGRDSSQIREGVDVMSEERLFEYPSGTDVSSSVENGMESSVAEVDTESQAALRCGRRRTSRSVAGRQPSASVVSRNQWRLPRYKNMIIVPRIFSGEPYWSQTPLSPTPSPQCQAGRESDRLRGDIDKSTLYLARRPRPCLCRLGEGWRKRAFCCRRACGALAVSPFSVFLDGSWVLCSVSRGQPRPTPPFPHLQLLSHVLLSRKGSYHDMGRRDQHPLATRLLPPFLQ